jgi:hypothetical protein
VGWPLIAAAFVYVAPTWHEGHRAAMAILIAGGRG